ncbi:MAG: hypothetical protein P4L99_25505 [Chthoniobacter sp.]|nr:hypothetical protein [Chthoniobacter sp.]
MANPAPIHCSAVERRRLDEILNSPPPGLPAKKLRHLRILKALCDGVPGAKIIEGVTSARVSDIRREAAEQTVAVVIERLLARAKVSDAAQEKARTHAGRPGHEEFTEWMAEVNAEDESVFELSTLYVSRDVQIAVISFREGRHRDYKKKAEEKDGGTKCEETLRNRARRIAREIAAASKTRIFWCRILASDTAMAESFYDLKKRLGGLPCHDDTGSEDSNIAKLSTRFDERFAHIVLTSGRQKICKTIVSELGKGTICRHLRADAELGLLGHLEAALHARRLKKSSVGFFPLALAFGKYVNNWVLNCQGKPFHWQIHRGNTQDFLKGHLVVHDYFAVKGALLEMSGGLWQKIPFQDEIPSGTLSLRTRVEIKDVPASGQVRLAVRPLPGIEYRVVVDCPGTPEDKAKVLRTALNREKRSKRLVYSSCQGARAKLRRSIIVPVDFFTGAAEAKSLGKGVGVVLLPRHFLTPEPAIPLQDLVALGQKAISGVTAADLETTGGRELGIALHVPKLLEAIRKKTEEWWYHDRIEDLGKWQVSLLKLSLWESLSDGEIKWMEFFQKLNVTAGLEEAAWERLKNNGEVRGRLKERIKGRELPLPLGKGQRAGGAEPPVLSWDEMFENLLRQVDADFLLLGLDEKTRRALDATAAQWAAAVAEIPMREFWPEGKLKLAKVKTLVSEECRDAFESHREDEVQSWCNDAWLSFADKGKFVLRMVIENMQRLVLHGLPAMPIAVESHGGILRRWERLLRKILNARLAPLKFEEFSDSRSQENYQSPQSRDNALYDNERGIEELSDMVRPLPYSSKMETYRIFFNRVRHKEAGDSDLWRFVIDELDEDLPGFGWRQRLNAALEICRGPSAKPTGKTLSRKLFVKLRRLFTQS